MQVHIPLLILCVLLCLIPSKHGTFREKWIMPLCMLLITVYMAIRYDYGLDFWSYYNAFFSETTRTEVSEPLFWLFAHAFSKYYQLVAASSIALMIAIFFWVKKYIPYQWYSLFFLCFMCIPGMCFSMMTAMRTVMAFVVMTWGLYKYYIKSNRVGLFVVTVIIATLFHNSAIFFLLLPLITNAIWKVKPFVFFVIFIIFSLFSFTGITQEISNSIFGLLKNTSFIDADYYMHYADKYVSNVNGAIARSMLLFPAFFICKYARKIKDEGFKQFYVLSIIYLSIYFLSLDIEYRFTLYLFIFFIIALAMCLRKMKLLEISIAVLPVAVLCVYQLNNYYNLMREEMFGDYSEGNFFIYETIFDNLPLI